MDALAAQPPSGCDRGSRSRCEVDSRDFDSPTDLSSNATSCERPFCWSQSSSRIARLNAPRDNGGKLIEPPLEYVADMAATNHGIVAAADYDVQGRSLADLACEARQQLLAAAAAYTRSYRDVSAPDNPAAVFLAGHQPEMFHPGVWLKNFVLDRLAQRHGAVAVNLQIDSDAVKSTSLRVPSGSVDRPHIEAIPFDRAGTSAAFEQRTILDRSLFDSFGGRAAKHLETLIGEPLLWKYWPLVVARSRETNNLGACISQARHQLESQWGLETLEIPQSRVCDLPAFRWFVAHLLAHLPRFWEVYNSALLEYRRLHKVRSSAHPAPELDADDDWLEAPLWIWSNDDPRRRRLFVRQRNDELVLSDRENIETTISIAAEGSAVTAVEQLAALSARGIRLRTRALITTLAARLLLGDLFMHGIGGAKYDQLTDRIIQRFFGLKPPGYMCVSGTLRLPIAMPSHQSDELREVRQRIRQLQFQPERFLDDAVAASSVNAVELGFPADWIAEKRRWIATEPTPQNARQRCRAIRGANEALQPSVAKLRENWTADAERLSKIERSEAVLLSREYAFPLFPELALTKFLEPILENSAATD